MELDQLTPALAYYNGWMDAPKLGRVKRGIMSSLKLLLEMRHFQFRQFKKKNYMKLFSLLILSKNTKKLKKQF